MEIPSIIILSKMDRDYITSVIDDRDLRVFESILGSILSKDLYYDIHKYLFELLDEGSESVFPLIVSLARIVDTFAYAVVESLLEVNRGDILETLLEDPQVVHNLLKNHTTYKLNRDLGDRYMDIIRRTIEDSMSLSSFIDQVYQLQDLYYLLSKSNVSKKRINRDFAESLFGEPVFDYNEIELSDLSPISNFEKKEDEPPMSFELETYKDLLNLIYWILYKFAKDENRGITVKYGKLSIPFNVGDDKQLALISPIISHLQGFNLKDDGVGIPLKPVNVSPLLDSIDRIMNALKYFIKTENDYNNLTLFFLSAQRGFDILTGFIDDKLIYFSLRYTLMDMEIIKSARNIMDKIITEFTPKLELDVMLERLAVLDYYYRMSSTLAASKGRLEIEWKDLEDKNPPKPVEFETRRFNIQEYDFDITKNEFSNIYGYVDPSNLKDIQELTYKILDRHRPSALVDGIYLRRESHPFGIINPLIRYYEQQDYSRLGDKFIVTVTDVDYIKILEMHRDIMRVYESFENEWKGFVSRDVDVEKFVNDVETYEYKSKRSVPYLLVPMSINEFHEEAKRLESKYDRIVSGITKFQRKYIERLYSPTGALSNKLMEESMQALEEHQ